MCGDEPGKTVARLVHFAAGDELADLDRQSGVLGRRPGRGPSLAARRGGRHQSRSGLARRLMVTHRRITVWALTRLQSTAACANLLTCVHAAATISSSRHVTGSSHVRNIEMSLDTERSRSLEHEGVQAARVWWNLPQAALYEQAVRRREGLIAASGPLVCRTGPH